MKRDEGGVCQCAKCRAFQVSLRSPEGREEVTQLVKMLQRLSEAEGVEVATNYLAMFSSDVISRFENAFSRIHLDGRQKLTN